MLAAQYWEGARRTSEMVLEKSRDGSAVNY